MGDSPYNVRRHQKVDHVEYDVLGSNNMTAKIKVLGDVLKPGAYRHVVCMYYVVHMAVVGILNPFWRSGA